MVPTYSGFLEVTLEIHDLNLLVYTATGDITLLSSLLNWSIHVRESLSSISASEILQPEARPSFAESGAAAKWHQNTSC